MKSRVDSIRGQAIASGDGNIVCTFKDGTRKGKQFNVILMRYSFTVITLPTLTIAPAKIKQIITESCSYACMELSIGERKTGMNNLLAFLVTRAAGLASDVCSGKLQLHV